MADLIYLLIAIGFFAICVAYVKGCQSLMGDQSE